jgi:hypothetical protein
MPGVTQVGHKIGERIGFHDSNDADIRVLCKQVVNKLIGNHMEELLTNNDIVDVVNVSTVLCLTTVGNQKFSVGSLSMTITGYLIVRAIPVCSKDALTDRGDHK